MTVSSGQLQLRFVQVGVLRMTHHCSMYLTLGCKMYLRVSDATEMGAPVNSSALFGVAVKGCCVDRLLLF